MSKGFLCVRNTELISLTVVCFFLSILQRSKLKLRAALTSQDTQLQRGKGTKSWSHVVLLNLISI